MSIRPRYCQLIFAGRKRFELRRRPTRIRKNDLVIVYAPSPLKAIVGLFEVASVLQDRVALFWQQYSEYLGVEKCEYESYFADNHTVYAIEVGSFATIEPISLTTLRAIWPRFRPPQSYMYLSVNLPNSLNRLTQAIAAVKK